MKTLILCLALLASVAAAQPDRQANPVAELVVLTECTANEITLMQMQRQTVAVIRATMPDKAPPQLVKLLDSYTALATDAHEQVDSYMTTINDVVIPQIVQAGGDADSIGQKFMTVLYHKVIRNAVAQGDPTSSVENQTTAVRGIIDQAHECASLAAAVREEYKGTAK
jgi:hypothetical protein